MAFRCGYVAIVGRPNVGKSTLLNAILGERVAIVTPKPQTTRHRIMGILNSPDAQVIFLDTPGYHLSRKPLNQAMNEIVDRVQADADLVCLLMEAGKGEAEIERELFRRIGADRALVVLTKCDLIPRDRYDELARHFRDAWGAKELVILSALKNQGVATLVEALKERLPEGPALYPDDIFTEHPVRFLVSELIREQLFLQMREEIPYAAAVVIEEFKDTTPDHPVTLIRASIVLEKESQKGMVVGRGGRRIKEIGRKSRPGIEALVGGKVFLDLSVRVEKDWTKDHDLVRKLGCSSEVE